MKTMCALLLVSVALNAQSRPKSYWYEGLWQGYDGEWTHVTRQVMALAETTPADKYQWRPEPGVRSFSEIYMHIAIANFGLLAVTGPKMPTGLNERSEAGVTEKAQVLDWLTKSFEAVRIERAKLQPADFGRKVKNGRTDATVDGMYMRIIVHANEHLGQAVAYARVAGFAPPWAEK